MIDNKGDDSIISEVGLEHFYRNVEPLDPIINNNLTTMSLFRSPRFIGILVIGALQTLVVFGYITDAQSTSLVQIVQAVIAGAIAVGTADRIGKQAV